MSRGGHGSIIDRLGLDFSDTPSGDIELADGRRVTVQRWFGTYHWIKIIFDERGRVVGAHLIKVHW